MNKITGLLIIGLIVVGGVLFFNQNKPSSNQKKALSQTTTQTITIPTATSSSPVKEFSITAKSWAFDPAIITIKQGDKVKLTINSIDVTHGFALPDFNVKVDLTPNNEEVVEFIADKKGEYTFFCSVICGQGHKEMTGKLVVE